MRFQVWSYCPDTERQAHYSIGCGATVMTCNDPMPALRLRKLLGAKRRLKTARLANIPALVHNGINYLTRRVCYVPKY